MSAPKVTWRFAALTQWPGKPTPSYQRKAAPFKSTYERTKKDLERELSHLGARGRDCEADAEAGSQGQTADKSQSTRRGSRANGCPRVTTLELTTTYERATEGD